VTILQTDPTQTTIDLIRKIGSSGKHLLLLPIDLVTNLNLSVIVDFHLRHKSGVTVVATDFSIEPRVMQNAPGYRQPVRGAQQPRRFLVYDESNPTKLVALLSDRLAFREDMDRRASDVSEDRCMSIPGECLAGFRSLVIDHTKVLSGIYVLSPQAVAELNVNQAISSLETEFIPELCLSWAKPPPPGYKTGQPSLFIVPSDVVVFHIVDYATLYVANQRCSFGKLEGFVPAAEFVKSGQNGWFIEGHLRVPERFVYQPFCVYGDNLTVADDVVIERTVIGRHCRIGKGARIKNSIILDHVTIEDAANLQNCLICANGLIKATARLKQCLVAPGAACERGAKMEGKTLLNKE
jgi:NDP-sugar pyrophosphorylase family protein